MNDLNNSQDKIEQSNSKDIFKNPDFMDWVEKALVSSKMFNVEYYLSLFSKLKNEEDLSSTEIKHLKFFIENENVKTNLEPSYYEALVNYDFLNEKIQNNISNVTNKATEVLDPYAWMKKIQINTNDWLSEIYIDKNNLKVDSSNWQEEIFDWKRVKFNPQRDIIEFLEWEIAGQQVFSRDAWIREAAIQWKRLPKNLNLEFDWIIEKLWIEEFTSQKTAIVYILKWNILDWFAWFWVKDNLIVENPKYLIPDFYSFSWDGDFGEQASRWNYFLSVRLVKE